jgi:hypothetical protein
MLIKYKNILHLAGIAGFLLGIALTIIYWTDTHGILTKRFGDHMQVVISMSYFFGLMATLSNYIHADVTIGQQHINTRDPDGPSDAGAAEDGRIDYSSIASQMDKIYQSQELNKIKSDRILRVICNGLNASQGALYTYLGHGDKPRLSLFSSYAFVPSEEEHAYEFETTDGLVGLAVKEDREVELNDIPRANFKVFSGLGNTANASVVIIPVKMGEEIAGAIELCFFGKQDRKGVQKFIHDNMSKIGSLL